MPDGAHQGERARAVLRIGGLEAAELADRFGTPLYAYDAGILRSGFQAVRSALGNRTEISYALKANPSLAVSDVLRREGTLAEVASAGEIHAAISAGFTGQDIQFAGPGKSRQEIDFAVQHGVARLNIESRGEYLLVADISRERGVRQGVSIRVNPDQALSGARMHMGGGSQKFGVDVDQLEELVRRILDEDTVELQGLHVYGGTQCFDASAWLKHAHALLQLANRLEKKVGCRLHTLNFGGGFGVPCYDGDPTFDLKGAGDGLQALIASDGRDDRQYHVELGRYLVASAGVYLTRVSHIKESGGRQIAILDGGMHHHAAAAGIGSVMRRSFPIVACHDIEGKAASYCLGGPLCTPADEFASAALLPELSGGDILAILGSGAYGLTFSNVLFLSHPTPAEVLVDRGLAALIRRRGSLEDSVRDQELPGEVQP